MVTFLEIPFNFNLMDGKGTDNLKAKELLPGPRLLRRRARYDMVNSKCGTNWTTKTVKDRLQ